MSGVESRALVNILGGGKLDREWLVSGGGCGHKEDVR